MTEEERKERARQRGLAANARWRAKNREQERLRSIAYRAANPEKVKLRIKAYYEANKETLQIKGAAYRATRREEARANARENYAKNRDLMRARDKAYRTANPEQSKATKKAWRQRPCNAEKEKAYQKAYTRRNRAKITAVHREWARANKGVVNAIQIKRWAKKVSATPPWANHDIIAAIYAEAARLTDETGIVYQVDHIYPLQGRTVCGLHVEHNLQILTREENISKHNKMPTRVPSQPSWLYVVRPQKSERAA